jgi:thymidylate synthase
MPTSVFRVSTIDDALRSVFEEIRGNGEPVTATKGPTLEITGTTIEIENPRARLSRTDTRGRAFSCLGELCWYLAGSDDLEFIAHYISEYRKYAEDGRLFGAYGHRLFHKAGFDQIANATRVLRRKSTSRQVVLQIFNASDIKEEHKDVPCTCTLQFLLRRDGLHLLAYMRSNDAYLGFPHDVFCFTMLQEIVARDLGVEIAAYKHIVGSLHLYEKDLSSVDEYLNEGWQSTKDAMPPMPADPWPAVSLLLDAEERIRSGAPFDEDSLNRINSYWADLIRLLLIHKCKHNGDIEGISRQRERINRFFFPFIDRLT